MDWPLTARAICLWRINGSGNIYEFTPGGVQSTFASGLCDPYGLAFNSAGDLFEADYGSGNIYEFTPGGAAKHLCLRVVWPGLSRLPARADALHHPFRQYGDGLLAECVGLGIAANQQHQSASELVAKQQLDDFQRYELSEHHSANG